MSENIIEVTGLYKNFKEGKNDLHVLKNISFAAEKAMSVAILGGSGSGKSTFLQLLGGLDSFEKGEILINKVNIKNLSISKKCDFRNKNIGFIYQFHHLLPEFNALNNVMMPLLIGHEKESVALKKSKEILDKIGLGHRFNHKPGQLSGGEKQRVAIARALVTNPKCILADEPTGNLDTENGELALQLLLELVAENKSTLVMVTHDKNLANKCSHIYEMRDGVLEKCR